MARSGRQPHVALRGLGPDHWGDRGAEELDRIQPFGLGEVAEVHLEDVPAVTQHSMEGDQSLGDLFGAAGEHHPAGAGVPVELRPATAHRRSAMLSGVGGEGLVLVGKVALLGSGVVLADEATRGDGDVETVFGVPGLAGGLAVETGSAHPLGGTATQDPKGEGEAEEAGSDAGAWVPPGTKPES